MTGEAQIQTYDNVIKRLFERHAEEAIPLFLEEKELAKNEDKKSSKRKVRPFVDEESGVEELNIEALIPPRRNDRVYRSPYKGRMHIVEVEIETSPNGMMAVRSLIYHALLLEKYYGEAIMSMILYPFKMPIVGSPLEETNGDGNPSNSIFVFCPCGDSTRASISSVALCACTPSSRPWEEPRERCFSRRLSAW